MTIENLKQNDLSPNERDVLIKDRERWKHMGAGAHLNDWLEYFHGLRIRRNLAMKIAHTNRPEGKGYALAFAQLMKHDGLDTMDKTSISAVLWLGDNPEHMIILNELLDAMSPGQRSRLNSPISARQRVLAVLKARDGGTEESVRMSPVALLKKQISEAQRTIARLQEEKNAREVDGSRFDLRHDSADDIARVVVDTISQDKARKIAKAITDAINTKRRKPVPAG